MHLNKSLCIFWLVRALGVLRLAFGSVASWHFGSLLQWQLSRFFAVSSGWNIWRTEGQKTGRETKGKDRNGWKLNIFISYIHTYIYIIVITKGSQPFKGYLEFVLRSKCGLLGI